MSSTRRILITGAGSGIGLETALKLSENGHTVIAGIRNPDKFKKAWKARAGNTPPPFQISKFDVTKATEVNREIKRLLKDGSIDTLINNAGYGLYGCFEELPDKQFQEQFDTNLFGILNVTRALLPAMRAMHAGQIINVSSILGRVVLPTGSAYCSSKWAVSGFTRSLRYELSPLGIQVCAVEPGLIRTAFKENMRVPAIQESSGNSPGRKRSEKKSLSNPSNRGISRDNHSDYEPFNHMIAAEIKEYGRFSTPAEKAGRKLSALVERRRLPASYRIGLDAKLVYGATRLLPESWLDAALKLGTKRTYNAAGN